MQIRSFHKVALAAAMIVLTACAGDAPLAPTSRAVDVNHELFAATNPGTGAVADTAWGTMIVGPQGGNWVFGEHKINFPANSICDMSQTNYFAWGQSCTPITSDVRIDLKWWRDAAGHPHVDFTPALRFQPTRKGEVTLYLKDQAAAKAQSPVIGYCAVDLFCVDESGLDNALQTKRDAKGGFVYRIIRHFSGYNVWA